MTSNGGRSLEDLKDALITAGVEVLKRVGTDDGPGGLTYCAVLAALGDPALTVDDIDGPVWPSLRDFQLKVIERTLEDVEVDNLDRWSVTAQTAMNDVETSRLESWRERAFIGFEGIDTHAFEAWADTAFETLRGLELNSPADRRWAARELTRIGQNANWESAFSKDHQLAVFQSVRFALAAIDRKHTDYEALLAQVKRTRRAVTAKYMELSRAMMALIGTRLRPEFDADDDMLEFFVLSASAINSGFAGDELTAPDRTYSLPTGRDGEPQRWYPSSLAVWAVLSMIVELDGDDLTAEQRRL